MALKNGKEPRKPKRENEFELTENDLRSSITLKPSQTKYLDAIVNNDVTFCYGPAGTSKTFTACYAALKLYFSGQIKTIILSKPIRESGEKLGFLPGEIKDKIDPFMESYRLNLVKLLKEPRSVNWLETAEIIKFQPLAYMRGVTYDNSLMILDEAQNANFKQIMLFVTRMGKGSKVLVCGDVSQYDIEKDQVALPAFIKVMEGLPGLSVHRFVDKDIVRNEILTKITKRYEQWKEKNPDHAFLR